MKPLVIYHANCTDGFGAAFAAWLKLGKDADYRAMSYDRIKSDHDFIDNFGWIDGRDVYIIDFSFPKEVMDGIFGRAKRVVWLDHHKTAFEMWCPEEKTLYDNYIVSGMNPHRIILDNNKSGAMLAWEHFHPGTEAPMFIRHIDDRDRWQFKLENSKEFHAALASYKPWTFEQWHAFKTQVWNFVDSFKEFIDQGAAILRAQEQAVQEMAAHAQECRITQDDAEPGDTFFNTAQSWGLICNSQLHISELGHELANRSGTYGLIWYLGANGEANCSLRSNGDYDVSAIAKKFGGGGHRNAAGFSVDIETLLGWVR